MEFIATCPKGFEQLLAQELTSLGCEQVRPLMGQVSFGGTLSNAYRVCLWSRLASRITLILARIDAADTNQLYEGISTLPWEEHIPTTATIAVNAHGMNEELRNTQFIALRTKDAISDRMLAKKAIRLTTDPTNPDLRITLRLRNTTAMVGIDLSGNPLFRRGYEMGKSARQPIAPLRPDYAAALLAQAGWFRACRHDNPTLLSVYTGAGTILAEAAAQALDRAPGLLRSKWGFEGWLGHDSNTWTKLLTEADERAKKAANTSLTLIGTDDRRGWESATRQTVRVAGIFYEPQLVSTSAVVQTASKLNNSAVCVCDLSFFSAEELPIEARALSVARGIAAALPQDVSLSAVDSTQTLDDALAMDATEHIDILLGQDKASIRSYDLHQHTHNLPLVTYGDNKQVAVLMEGSSQFSARLTKMYKLRKKWAKREFVSCYRVYDADLPDYAAAIDLYEGLPRHRGGVLQAPERWAVVAEYAAPKTVDSTRAHERLLDMLTLTPLICNIDPTHVYVKTRKHSKGGSQYAQNEQKDDQRRHGRLIDENGLTFEVNFEDYLDTGLFLDHRDTRNMLRELAKKVPEHGYFCNLFAYTGSATCYVADGGARNTTTVDMSRTYLDWAQRNMRRNGFTEDTHKFVQADVLQWIDSERHSTNRYDLIFCDPPTFSNSSRMRKRGWDVQRDHVELLISLSRMLSKTGVCVFSCNLRNFKPDVEALTKFGVKLEDITEKTIPEDFERNSKIHHCYLVRRSTPSSKDSHSHSNHGGRRSNHKKA
ncbi:bifunctional 23S rRNA (guanine(2069)-N(7))-methyltransferase RlmK/23S rRNA (guanine(2445)-N(2))-methyltransferase RlmL [Atopobium fossor]|uniref:bifunctional 23S rRNA (guanine(2069)-N(7))-methyltransferase RlmK/23S rRNA (guanine(2445)-N(2))-methyltransferase RlmL n=1 Tax=Atopobium fossor TaxID=39487 RepID=UPI0004045BD1|nr:bifunctional 23S rRNA (guanine(2069)-N(7))-methyltransferase RlmK/23S rRNA (guanine(2445)-N(2))-methyltransferase RlmL [Atopobium fossor]